MARAAGLNLNPAALLTFGALARSGSVRSAAAALGTPRSTISRRLAELEAQVGAPLAIRTARRFALTELGAALAASCDELEAAVRRSEELVRSRSREPVGALRVAVAPVLGEEVLPVILAELVRRHPRLSVDARLAADYVDLRHGAIDVALRAGPLADADDLFAVRLGTSVTGCYLSPRYAAEHGRPASPMDLGAHECVLVGGQARVTWAFKSGGRKLDVPVAGRVRVDSFRVARDVAALGVGVVRLATVFAAPLVATGELIPVLERFWPTMAIHAVHAGPRPPLARVRAFVEAARVAVARALPGERAKATRWRSA